MNFIKRILSYWDRALCALIFIIALGSHMEAVAITFALLTIIGPGRIRDFILALLVKIEQSEEGGFGPASWKKPSPGIPPAKPAVNYPEKPGSPTDFQAYFNEGSFKLQRGDYYGAKELFEKAEKIEPMYFDLNVSLGLVYDLTHEYQKSIDRSKKALEIKPGSFVPQFNLAVATNHLLGATKSLPEYQKAEELMKITEPPVDDLTVGKLNLFMGHDYRDLRNNRQAFVHYWTASEILKGFDTPDARFWLKDARDALNRLEENK
jgi:tetratricopeptide (TPR) repeat protein